MILQTNFTNKYQSDRIETQANQKTARLNLKFVNFNNANLSNTNLRDSDLRYANLRNADLRNADLRYADLRNADLRYTDLNDAIIDRAMFGNNLGISALTRDYLTSRGAIFLEL